MELTNEHIVIFALVSYILYSYLCKNKNIETITKKVTLKNDSCKMPDIKTATCVAANIIKTKCVKCSLQKCDIHKQISPTCYSDEKHTCNDNNVNMYANMHDSMHDNQFNSMHESLNNTIYNPIKKDIPNVSNISGNEIETFDYNLGSYNDINNIGQQILNAPLPSIEDYNNRQHNPYAQSSKPRSTGLERSLDGSFFKYSKLG
jgi:hypothetical protein